MATESKLHIITGPTLSGKTSLVEALAELGFATQDNCISEILGSEVMNGKPAEEVTDLLLDKNREHLAATDSNVDTFFDQSAYDVVGLLRYKDIDDTKARQCAAKLSIGTVFWLMPLNEFEHTPESQQAAEDPIRYGALTLRAYKQTGLDPVLVPASPPRQRAGFVLSHLLGLQ